MKLLKSKRQFKVIIEQGESGYFIASVPALPGCFTQGKNLKELNKNIKEAIQLCLEEAEENLDYLKRIKELESEPSFVGIEIVTV